MVPILEQVPRSAETQTRQQSTGAASIRGSRFQLDPRRHFSSIDLLALACCIVFPSGWVLLTTFSLAPRQLLFFCVLAFSALVWGRVALVTSRLHEHVRREFCHSFFIGNMLLAFALAAIRLLTPLSMPVLFASQLIVGIGLYVAFSARIGRWTASRKSEWVGLWVVFLSLLTSTLWLRHLCPVSGTDGEYMAFKPFFEYFFHTTHVTPLLLPGIPIQNGSIHFAGVPLAYYHYASYTFPALLASVGGLSSYESLLALWFPYGTFFLGLAAFWLGQLLFGLRAGFWSFVAVRLLPDVVLWSFGMSMYSFDVFFEATPALAYAVSVAAISLSVMILGLRYRRMGYVVISFAVALATVFFKANVFMAIAPLCGLLFVSAYRRFGSRVMIPSLVVLIFIACGGLLLGTRLRSAPTIGLDPARGERFIHFLLEKQIAKESMLQRLAPFVDSRAESWRSATRLLFVLLVTFQLGTALLVAAILASLIQLRRVHWIHWLLFCVLAIYLGSAVFLPPNQNGDPFELQQRAYAWAYLVVVVWTTGVLVKVWNSNVSWRWRTGYLAALPLLFFPLVFGSLSFIEQPKPVHKGLTDSASYIRQHSRPLDVVWDSQNDPLLLVAAMSERRVYVGIALTEFFPGSGALKQLHIDRVEDTNRFKQSSSLAEIQEWVRKSGARWFLLHEGDQTAWPAEVLKHATFEAQGYRVYDLAKLGP